MEVKELIQKLEADKVELENQLKFLRLHANGTSIKEPGRYKVHHGIHGSMSTKEGIKTYLMVQPMPHSARDIYKAITKLGVICKKQSVHPQLTILKMEGIIKSTDYGMYQIV